MAWHLAGEYFENCNCDILCPCITSSMQGPADADRCRVPLIVHIDEGERDGVTLDGLNFVMVIDSPQVMAEGGWRVATYIDERADESQREALGAILSGAEGGAPAMLGPLVGENLGVKFVPIAYESSDSHYRAEVPGILECEVEGVYAPDSSAVMEVANVFHPMGSKLAIAKSLKGRYDDPDFGLSFDNTGKNGHFSAFAWSG